MGTVARKFGAPAAQRRQLRELQIQSTRVLKTRVAGHAREAEKAKQPGQPRAKSR